MLVDFFTMALLDSSRNGCELFQITLAAWIKGLMTQHVGNLTQLK